MNRLFLPMSFASFSLALLFTACSQPAGQQGGSEYKLITVEKTDQTLTSSYTAVINGRQSVEIRPQVSGTITDICVNEGAKVTKGQTLFIIDQVPYQSALQTALANGRKQRRIVQGTCRFRFRSTDSPEFFAGS